jgi:hypothetical protein
MALGALPEHDRHEGPDTVDDTPEIDSQHPLPVGDRELPGRLACRDARVVADYVDGAERRQRLLSQGFDIAGLRDVRPDGQHLGALRPQLALRSCQRVGLDVRQHDLHPLGREPLHQRPPDPAGGPGDHRDLALEALHTTSPSSACPPVETSDAAILF